MRLIHRGRSRRQHISDEEFSNVAHLSLAHLADRNQETPIAEIAAIQSSRSQLEAYGQPKEESSESLLMRGMLPGTMIRDKHKPIMENPVRDTKVWKFSHAETWTSQYTYAESAHSLSSRYSSHHGGILDAAVLRSPVTPSGRTPATIVMHMI